MELGKDRSYVRKLVKRLASEGLAEHVHGRQSAYVITRLGKIVLRLCKLIRHG